MTRYNDKSDIEKVRNELIEKEAGVIHVGISGGTCGCAAGANRLKEAFVRELLVRGNPNGIKVKVTGCHGFCNLEPMVVISRFGEDSLVMYKHVAEKDAAEIIEQSILKDNIVERLLYQLPDSGEKIQKKEDIPFFKLQTKRLLAWNDRIDPLEIDEYIAMGGYSAICNALEKKPEDIIEDIRRAGLRGRGGAGFPTALKWQLTRNAVAKSAASFNSKSSCYVVCNADEGDPGAYMDRSILEGNPHSVIEGMIIGGYAISEGLKSEIKGYVYVRAEYPMAIRHLHRALEQARERGLLGENILGSGHNFDIEIVKGAGAFVCGEETALLESIEDKIGEPRPKPPYPVENGLWNWPTALNNVKTWSLCRYIFDKGVEEFANVGTETSKGTMVFALVGNIFNSGLVEVPMGMTLKEIIEDIGHGVQGGGKAKAVQTGGPSGGCLPASVFDMPVDYESLTKAGTIMGSGGMIVMNEQTCMVDTAHYFLNFGAKESCGKCTPCREGLRHMRDIVAEIIAGKGRPEYLEILETLGEMIAKLSFCGLGKTAPNPTLSTLRYFRDEYEAHLNGKCPAKVCAALVRYYIIGDNCTGCGACARKCPVKAISGEKREVHEIDPNICIKCGICLKACKFDAVEVE